jgi:dihydropteroate synthase
MQDNLVRSLLDSPKSPLILGILNVTPDSFSDGGLYFSYESAIERGLQLLADGADMLDIGGASTKPPGKDYGAGALNVEPGEEAERILPVIKAILEQVPDAVISVDTTRAIVARRAIESGAQLINDVSAGTADRAMFETVSKLGVPIVLMHGYGPHFEKASIDEYQYQDVVREVYEYLEVRVREARNAGIETTIADVGIGFAKGFRDNLRLIKEHAAFEELGVTMMFGASRKSSIGKALDRETTPVERVSASVAAAIHAVRHGAKILRVHDVRETADAFAMLEAIEKS